MAENTTQVVHIGGHAFEVVKETRLTDGMVLRCDDLYARLGPKDAVLAEQVHTEALLNRGFPVAEVVESGPVEHPRGDWYFVEKSLGEESFHKTFTREYKENGSISENSFTAYLKVIDRYLDAQCKPENSSSISSTEFINTCLPENLVLQNYVYFGFEADEYRQAIAKATNRLLGAPMGILQYDLNPYNVLPGGVIDFELVGYGPLGFDTLTSARWGGTWFTSYPSRYPFAYRLSADQVARNDEVVRQKLTAAGLPNPAIFLDEFILLKSAWAALEFDVPNPEWPTDRVDFRRFRARLLNRAVTSYLADKTIDYTSFSDVPASA